MDSVVPYLGGFAAERGNSLARHSHQRGDADGRMPVKATSDNRPLRGTKGTAYEGGLRVPLIVRWPGHIEPGSVLDHPVTSLDIGATTCAMAGGDPSTKELDGVDITDLMTGQTDPALRGESFSIGAAPDFKTLPRQEEVEEKLFCPASGGSLRHCVS